MCVGGSLSDNRFPTRLCPLNFVVHYVHKKLYNTSSGRYLIKFADDVTLVSLLQGDEDSYMPVLDELISWCDILNLKLNISKTFFWNVSAVSLTTMKGEPIQSVTQIPRVS